MFRYLPQLTGLAAVMVGYTSVHKHMVGTRRHCKKVSLYKEEDEKPFDENTQKIVDELTDFFLLRLTPGELSRLKFFWTNSKDTEHFGTYSSRFGTYLGIPLTFGYQSRSDVDLSRLADCGVLITEDNPEALASLTESLVLSDNAKRFAIATELHVLNTFYVYCKLSYLLMALCAYTNGCMFSGYTMRKSKPIQLLCLYGIVSVWVAIYYLFEGALSVNRAVDVDKTAAEMGSDYLAGGIEYFTKLQQRNIALRKLQAKGPQMYTAKGNVKRRWYETPFASLSYRKKELVKLKTEEDRKKLETTDNNKLETTDNNKLETT